MEINRVSAQISRNRTPGSPSAMELDIRPIFASGRSPCGLIDEVVAQLHPGQDLVLFAPFEPIPLFTKLAELGFGHHSEKLLDGSWRILFARRTEPAQAPQQAQSCCRPGD